MPTDAAVRRLGDTAESGLPQVFLRWCRCRAGAHLSIIIKIEYDYSSFQSIILLYPALRARLSFSLLHLFGTSTFYKSFCSKNYMSLYYILLEDITVFYNTRCIK